MGRLFWKFFFFILLAQLTAVIGVGGALWWKHQVQDAARDAGTASRHPDTSIMPIPGSFDPGAEGARRPPPDAELPPGPDLRRPPPHGGERGPPRGAQFRPFIPLAVAFLVSLIFAPLLAWYFSKPIRSLRTAFDNAAAGNLDTSVSAVIGTRRDELADLGRDFDRMTGKLRALMDNQRRLLHDVSHELRSPLARLQAAIGLARQQPDKIEASLVRIERESVRMDKLIDELLTLSRLEAGVVGAMDEEINMGELMAEIIDDARFEAEASGRSVAFSGQSDVLVVGKPELLCRAIENVIRNAIKHTKAGACVTVQAGLDAATQRLRIAVLDRGPGIPVSELGAVFDPFFRSSVTAGGTNGHGLGLAIAQRVTLAHGGAIRASNRDDGGLCVEMLLPAKLGQRETRK